MHLERLGRDQLVEFAAAVTVAAEPLQKKKRKHIVSLYTSQVHFYARTSRFNNYSTAKIIMFHPFSHTSIPLTRGVCIKR